MTESGPQPPSTEVELHRLCTSLHLDAPVVHRFIADYLRLLEVRLQRIERALTAGDMATATVVLLSLATSSAMLGAGGVAEAADELRSRTGVGDPTTVEHQHRQLVAQAGQARQWLTGINAVAS
jgi:hypothetical protein